MNYKLTLGYDGTLFSGWQIQRHPRTGEQRTVQGEVQAALKVVEGRAVFLHGAGRTDAGVHAEAQVASVELQRALPVEKWRAALNGIVGRDVRVLKVEIVDDDFHARFSAHGKLYRYTIFNAPFASPFLARYALTESRRLDVREMHDAAQMFTGTHDFTAFSAAQSDVKDRVRTVTEIKVDERFDARSHGRVIEIEVAANGFLRFMVRSIIGTLLAIGRGELEAATIEQALLTGNRKLAGATAAAHGLTLVAVRYAPP